MSTRVIPDPAAKTDPPTVTSPSTGPSGGSPAVVPSSTPQEFRFGSNAPTWAQGKTAEEILGIAQQLEGVVRQHIQTPTPPVQPPQTPYTNQYGSYAPPGPTTPAFVDTDYVTGAQINQYAPKMVEQYVQPELQAVYENLASTNYNSVRRDNAQFFEKYGPEVAVKLAGVPKRQWTVDNINTVVDIVRGHHVKEIARVEAERLVAEMGSELRSTGSPLPSVAPTQPEFTLKSEKIPEDYKERAAKAGLTEATVDEFCRANYPDLPIAEGRKLFYGQFEKSVIAEVTRHG